MNWEDTPEEAAFREEVRGFVKERFPAGYRPDRGGEHSLEPEDVWGYNWPADRVSDDPDRRDGALAWAAALAERGWITPHWPTEYGGAGLSTMREFILQEEMMRARVPTVNGIGAFLLGPTLLAAGTEEQKAEHLPPIARGERTWAQGFSEPESGSDLASVRTRAVRDGDDYVVNGQKVWTSLGQYADWLFVLVRTDPEAHRHKGLTFLLVDTRTPGVTVRPIVDIRGDTPFAEVFFSDARVPVANRVGEENRGWYVAMTALSFERAGIGATVKFEQALSSLVDYVNSEEGRRYLRADTTGLRQEIARRYAEVRVLYNLARYTVSKQVAGDVPGYEASVNQLFGAELAGRIARTGATAFGAFAELWGREGAPLGAAFTHLRLDSVAATFLGGTTEIQRNVIATRGLGLPR
ncbi:acyl-CoA dehydrogenase family protein [Actinophytocola gossypii]|uniref:Acyl-CoA dehydrogenase family protein n=1 Tax=Actinophytocola gossypii TaxID=2812003 RepID=A0ABT2JK25_9PSEU|nr:acyl-CoA dehydrogenase family protein [Actinophytocola gossypii]MCT2588232.1 acyl-CoA dehydrogenase family protein [Actinophytocola gossypii]